MLCLGGIYFVICTMYTLRITWKCFKSRTMRCCFYFVIFPLSLSFAVEKLTIFSFSLHRIVIHQRFDGAYASNTNIAWNSFATKSQNNTQNLIYSLIFFFTIPIIVTNYFIIQLNWSQEEEKKTISCHTVTVEWWNELKKNNNKHVWKKINCSHKIISKTK